MFLFLSFSSAALFIFLATSARTRIIRIYLCCLTLLRRALCRIHPCWFRLLWQPAHVLPSALLLHGTADGRYLPECCCHLIKHVITAHLVLYKRISLAICLQTDTLTKLIHIINMIHPLTVNDFQKNDTLQLTDLLRLRELCFFCLIQLDCLLLSKHVSVRFILRL